MSLNAYDQQQLDFAKRQMEAAKGGQFGNLSQKVYDKYATLVGKYSLQEQTGASLPMPDLIGTSNNLNSVVGIGESKAALTDTQQANVTLLQAVGKSVFSALVQPAKKNVALTNAPSPTAEMAAADASMFPIMPDFFPGAVDDLFVSDTPEDSLIGNTSFSTTDVKKGLLYGAGFILALSAIKMLTGGKK